MIRWAIFLVDGPDVARLQDFTDLLVNIEVEDIEGGSSRAYDSSGIELHLTVRTNENDLKTCPRFLHWLLRTSWIEVNETGTVDIPTLDRLLKKEPQLPYGQ